MKSLNLFRYFEKFLVTGISIGMFIMLVLFFPMEKLKSPSCSLGGVTLGREVLLVYVYSVRESFKDLFEILMKAMGPSSQENT